MDCGSSKIGEGLQAHCKNQPSVHGQLAGISKLNPRRLGSRFYKSEVRSDLASAERAGSAGKHCYSRARVAKNSNGASQQKRNECELDHTELLRMAYFVPLYEKAWALKMNGGIRALRAYQNR